MRFAGMGGVTGAAKFALGDWRETEMGLPRLTSALASLSCSVTSYSDAGSHRIFIGQIEETTRSAGSALVYARSRFHRLQDAEHA